MEAEKIFSIQLIIYSDKSNCFEIHKQQIKQKD